jgi:hypothetical protein
MKTVGKYAMFLCGWLVSWSVAMVAGCLVLERSIMVLESVYGSYYGTMLTVADVAWTVGTCVASCVASHRAFVR